jgi:membrane associated rhomboid family serine protease
MLIPYELDVPFERTPWMNWLLVAGIVGVFCLQIACSIPSYFAPAGNENNPFEPFILRGFTLKGLFGHMFLHAGLVHLIGNMIFLWLFGNAVCQKIGNLIYLPVYLFLGLSAATVSLLLAPDPEIGAVGASGAINGIVGMYLVLYPRNDISVFYWWFLVTKGTFEISGYWMILMWLAFDIFGAIRGEGHVGYFAHLGGFFTGAALAVILLLTRRVVMDEKYEESLLDLIREKFRPKPEPPRLKTWMDVELAKESLQSDEKSTRIAKVSASVSLPRRGSRGRRPTLSGADIAPPQANDPYPPLELARNEPPPSAPKFIRYACSCGKRFKSHVALAGRVGECPQCKKQLVIPDGPIR